MNPVSSKVVAGAGAAGGSTPLSIVLIWALGLVHVTVPPEIAAAIAALVASLASLAAGYAVPHNTAPLDPAPPVTFTAARPAP